MKVLKSDMSKVKRYLTLYSITSVTIRLLLCLALLLCGSFFGTSLFTLGKLFIFLEILDFIHCKLNFFSGESNYTLYTYLTRIWLLYCILSSTNIFLIPYLFIESISQVLFWCYTYYSLTQHPFFHFFINSLFKVTVFVAEQIVSILSCIYYLLYSEYCCIKISRENVVDWLSSYIDQKFLAFLFIGISVSGKLN